MSVSWNWVLVVAGALLILVEVALGGFAGFDLVLIGSAFVLGGALGLVFNNAAIGFIVAGVLCLAYIAVGRRWVRNRMKTQGIESGTDALIGLRGQVVVRVSRHEPGQVKVRDEVWRAVPAAAGPDALEPGAEVTVAGVDGVTLQVR
jgi:membrane protein implicated in regulation of membrane protease activity